MPETSTPSADSFDRHVFILGRWQEYEGEARANLLRIVGIGAFYIVELLNYYGLQLGFIEIPQGASRHFHEAVTGLPFDSSRGEWRPRARALQLLSAAAPDRNGFGQLRLL